MVQSHFPYRYEREGEFRDFDRDIDHNGDDNFIDMPKYTQFSFLNRWKYYGSEKYEFQINLINWPQRLGVFQPLPSLKNLFHNNLHQRLPCSISRYRDQ